LSTRATGSTDIVGVVGVGVGATNGLRAGQGGRRDGGRRSSQRRRPGRLDRRLLSWWRRLLLDFRRIGRFVGLRLRRFRSFGPIVVELDDGVGRIVFHVGPVLRVGAG
jgi:hypothetical protein